MHSKWTDDYYAGLRIHESGNQRVEVEMVLLFITPRDFMGEFVLPIPTSSQIGISTKESQIFTRFKVKAAAWSFWAPCASIIVGTEKNYHTGRGNYLWSSKVVGILPYNGAEETIFGIKVIH